MILQRCPRLARAAEAGELGAALEASNPPGSEYLSEGLEREVIAELHTPGRRREEMEVRERPEARRVRPWK